MIWATLLAWEVKPTVRAGCASDFPLANADPAAAMLAMLSLPLMGYWAWFRDTGPRSAAV